MDGNLPAIMATASLGHAGLGDGINAECTGVLSAFR